MMPRQKNKPCERAAKEAPTPLIIRGRHLKRATPNSDSEKPLPYCASNPNNSSIRNGFAK
jgi:hypothetical protein